MTITPHLLASAAVASATTSNIFVAFLLGFVIHFILDAIPHVDPGTFHNIKIPLTDEEIELGTAQENKPWPFWIYAFAISEFAVVVILFFILFHNKPNFEIMWVGGLGGITVDILDNNPFPFLHKSPILKQLHQLHERVHYDLPANKWYWGLPVQLIIMGASLWYLLRF